MKKSHSKPTGGRDVGPSAIRSGLLVGTLLWAGCSSAPPNSSPYAPSSAASRNTLKAQELTQEAADIIDRDPAKAERLLREALTADITYGPAHNDLGVIELNRGNWYEAASEFEWARKLMPGHPDPRMNLGLTLERAGRLDDALANYDAALEAYPEHMPTMQAKARLQLRHDRADPETSALLRQIAFAGESAEWRNWASERLALAKDDGH